MPENRHLRFLLRLLYAALALAGLWLCVRFLLPWLLPFLLAWGLAALLEPAVGLLMRRLRLPRWGAAARVPPRWPPPCWAFWPWPFGGPGMS